MQGNIHPQLTAEAAPPELPPGTLLVSHGFRTGPYEEVSLDDPIANSSIFPFPKITAPEFFRCFTTVASNGGI